MSFFALGTGALGTLEEIPVGATPLQKFANDSRGLLFYVLEMDAFQPGSNTITYDLGLGVTALGTLALEAEPTETHTTHRASDVGYYSRTTDAVGHLAFPPYLQTAFGIDRQINLDLAEHAAGASWGSALLSNPGGVWDSIAASQVIDGRSVRILLGRKDWDADRQIHVDPPYGELVEVFRGVAGGPWFLGERGLEIPLRDASYRLETPIQADLYQGTGGAEGTADLAGRPKPMARGGRTLNPIQNVPLVLIDPTNLIYQYSDGPGTVVNLYERGYATFTADGDLASTYLDLVGTSVASGHYATANAVGMVKLGATAAGLITADVTGEFPVNGGQTTVAALARYLLTEEAGLSVDEIDTAGFLGLDAAYDYVAGIWIGPDPALAVDVVGYVLSSIGGKLIGNRRGRLRPYVPAPPADGVRPSATWTTAEIVSMVPRPLPQNLAPPTWRWRVGYQRNYTPQTTDLSTSVTDDRKAFLAAEYRFASFADAALLTTHRRPNDPAPLATCLLDEDDAQDVADALGALWGERRRLYDVTLWLQPLEQEIGNVVVISYPIEDFASGKLATIIGEQVRTGEATVTVQVLV